PWTATQGTPHPGRAFAANEPRRVSRADNPVATRWLSVRRSGHPPTGFHARGYAPSRGAAPDARAEFREPFQPPARPSQNPGTLPKYRLAAAIICMRRSPRLAEPLL